MGRRRLKWVDYGKMAATFVDLASDRAVRVAPRPEVPHAGHEVDPMEFWRDWTDDQLFSCVPVKVAVPEADKPGRPSRKALCDECGEQVQDGREVVRAGRTLCRACADGAYYQK